MIFNHVSITSSGTAVQTLSAAVAGSERVYTIERLFICNTDSSDITVNLYLDDGTDQFFLLKGVTIPTNQTLDFLNGVPYSYQASYAIKLTLGDANYTADIIFNQF